MKHTYYNTCPKCGCSLDPNERCEDCDPRERIPYPNSKDYKSVKDILRKVVNQPNGISQKSQEFK